MLVIGMMASGVSPKFVQQEKRAKRQTGAAMKWLPGGNSQETVS
jgi:hypothetical protein